MQTNRVNLINVGFLKQKLISFLLKIAVCLFLFFGAKNSYGQETKTQYKFPLLIKTFQIIKTSSVTKYDNRALILLFTKSLDSVFNFNQKITQNGTHIRIDIYDSVLSYNNIKKDSVVYKHEGKLISWGDKQTLHDIYERKNLQNLDRYCNIIEPKINFILTKYNFHCNSDFFLSNFLISLICADCSVMQWHNDGRTEDYTDVKFFKPNALECIIYEDINFSDSIKVKAGDRILKIGNIPVQLLTYGLIENEILAKKDSATQLLIQRANNIFPITYKPIKDTINKFEYKKINDSIGVLKIKGFIAGTTDSIRKKLLSENPNIKKLIIDLRQCPGGVLREVIEFSDLFLESKFIIGERIGSSDQKWNRTIISKPDNIFPDSKLFILTDSFTSSGAEIIAAALKTFQRAKIIGQPTSGFGSIRQTIPLSYSQFQNNSLIIKVSDFITAKKYKLGVDKVYPDEYIIPSNDNETDNVLNQALEECR